jgi:hypothetical protein
MNPAREAAEELAGYFVESVKPRHADEAEKMIRDCFNPIAELLGVAFIRALQGDYSEIDELVREVEFDFSSGSPRLTFALRQPERLIDEVTDATEARR